MSDSADLPETHPTHRVEIQPGHGPTLEFQAVPGDSFLADSPHVYLTFRASGGEYKMCFSYRASLSEEEMGALIDALSRAREDARRQAALFGWEPGVE